MEWVKDFYDKQFLWSKTDIDYDMEEFVDGLVDKMERFSDAKPKKILELGGGNGQFAVSAARRGYDITVIELVPSCVEHTKKLAEKYQIGDNLQIIEDDFYQVTLNEKFDLVCYWDGFGVGTDSDQQLLLERISKWLKPKGISLIDIYTPWYWAKAAGEGMNYGEIARRYDFDAVGCRMLDSWWKTNEEDQKITQSLRCYSPADLHLLLQNIDVEIEHCEPGGAMDYEKWQYHQQVPLAEAMSYMVKIRKSVKISKHYI